MNLNYTDFYNRIWNHYISESDVSLSYREDNADFIRAVTFSFWRDYEVKNVSDVVYAKMLKIVFQNLFIHQPSTFDDGEIVDFNRE